ncbi:Alpha/Beta hydrolase protein [Pholiota molesta]|nr:Alpha/Beta hydrolase protein [Pholiota molesta]
MSSDTRTGKVDFKLAGPLNGEKTPVVALHGGPGMTHHYMLPHEILFKEGNVVFIVTSIPVVFYEQIGNRESSHIKDKPNDSWISELFMDEVDNLLKHLGIYDNSDLLGSFVGRLIIANSPASVSLFVVGTNALLEKFPPEFVKNVRRLEAEGKTSSPEYQQSVMQFYAKHVCTTNPWPQGLIDSFNAVEKNPTVYHTMFGPSEFNITGTLKDWSIVDILHKIPYTTLLVGAPLDEVQESACSPFFFNIPKVKWVDIPTGTHLAMYEDPDRYFDVLQKFLL